MAKAQKLVNKMKRRERSVSEASKLWKEGPTADKRTDTLQDSPKAQRLMRGSQRRLDASWGKDMVRGEPVEFRMVAPTMARFDYDPGAGTDFGIRMVLPNPLVIAAAEVTEVTTRADVAGDLNDTYWTFDTPTTDYYVWYNINAAGTDPLVAGRTGIEVAAATGATAAQVATATAAAIDPVGPAAATALADVVTLTNAATGSAPDAADSGAAPTDFTFDVNTQGVAESGLFNEHLGVAVGDCIQVLEGAMAGRMLEVVAITDSTHLRLDDVSTFTTESNVAVRAMLSTVKKSYR